MKETTKLRAKWNLNAKCSVWTPCACCEPNNKFRKYFFGISRQTHSLTQSTLQLVADRSSWSYTTHQTKQTLKFVAYSASFNWWMAFCDFTSCHSLISIHRRVYTHRRPQMRYHIHACADVRAHSARTLRRWISTRHEKKVSSRERRKKN